MNQFQTAISSLIDKVSGWVNDIILALPNMVVAAIVLGVSFFLSRKLKIVVVNALSRTTKNQTIISLVSTVAVALFMLIAIFVVLNILHLSDAVTALMGTAGVIGLAVGLALQDPIINLFSGLLMSTKHFYKVGDLIETNGYFGTIKEITLRDTVLRQSNGSTVVIPNKDVLQQSLTNISHSNERRVEVACGVSYGDDLENVKTIAINAIKDSDINYDASKPIQVLFSTFGDSSVNFNLRFWLKDIDQDGFELAIDQSIIAVKKAFDKNDISIPFPIQTLDFGIKGGLGINDIYPAPKLQFSQNPEVTKPSVESGIN